MAPRPLKVAQAARPRKLEAHTRKRFLRRKLVELVEHLGRPPSVPERIIIERICAMQWELQKFDARVEAEGLEGLSGHLLRNRLAAENRLRLDLQAVGLAPRGGVTAGGARRGLPRSEETEPTWREALDGLHDGKR